MKNTIISLALCGLWACASNDPAPAPDAGAPADASVAPDAAVEPSVRVLFDPTLSSTASELPAKWLAFPFPSDHRRTPSGHVRLADFPNPDSLEILTNYISYGEKGLDGFSTNGGIFFAFDGALDEGTLPGYLESESTLQIVDVTPTSRERGSRRPVRWEYRASAGKFWPANMLAMAPGAGFPLREHTTYAAIVTDGVRGSDGIPLRAPPLLAALLAGSSKPPEGISPAVPVELYSRLLSIYAPLRAQLTLEGVDPSSVAAAVVFTTQSLIKDLAAIHAQVAKESAPTCGEDGWRSPSWRPGQNWAALNYGWREGEEPISYWVMEGRYVAKNYQEGEIPYATTGGGIHLENGTPKPVRDEEIRFVLTFPWEPPRQGACYRIVEVSHGTGGDAYTFVEDGTAGRLAARGMAGIGIDQPLHGIRNEGKLFNLDLMSFNFQNMPSARGTFAQSAIDTFQLTRFVRESLRVPASKSPTGQEICFDAERVGFFGHSQGGITGAISAPFEREIGAWMLSGTGGVVSRTLVQRTIPIDLRAMAGFVFRLPASEPLTELHPIAMLVQALVDPSDPINYAAYWSARPDLRPPASVMLTSGLHDQHTTYHTSNALAVAAGLPLVLPAVAPSMEYVAAAIPAVSAPVKDNIASGVTGGFLQWTNDIPGYDYDTHFLVFNRPEAIHATMRFLESAAFEGTAVIERDPASKDR